MVKEVKSKLKNSVMKKISQEDIQMHSKFYYVLLNTTLVVSVAGVLLLSAIFLGIFARDVNVGRQLDLPAFGAPGVSEFVWRFPWAVTLLTAMAGVSLYWLIKKFSFSYKHGLYALVGAIILSMIGLSFVVSATGFGDRFADKGLFKPLSTYKRLAEENIYTGTISAINGSEFELKTYEGSITVVITNDTRRPPEIELKVGDEITVIGEIKDEIIRAEAIKFGKSMHHGKIRGKINWLEIKPDSKT